MIKKSERLHFEEAAIDDTTLDAARVERPIGNGIFVLVAAITVLVTGVAIGRALYVGWWRGDFYLQRAQANARRSIIIPAQRGLIEDRFEKPLVRNIPSFSVAVNIGAIVRASHSRIEEWRYITDAAQALADALGVDVATVTAQASNINIENNDRIIVARSVPLDVAIALKTKNVLGIEVEDDYQREYIDGPTFAHVVGYTGVGGTNNGVVGVSGLEAEYDDILMGQDGEYFMLRNAYGNDIDKKIVQEAQSGKMIVTTIDAEFQKYFYNRFQQGLTELGRNSGVGMAINPQTGELLALINFPSFDNSAPERYLTSPLRPLFNRAIAGAYSPGSTIKPLVALAALHEQVVTPQWQTYSSGVLEVPNPYQPNQPSRFVDWRAHGWVDVRSALARSSNIYFYIVGGGCAPRANCEMRPQATTGLGISRLREYWQQFGLGEPTGIDLGGEGIGFLPAPNEKKERTGQIWRIGDTYNVSIGQGDLTMTPIRLLSIYASIANDGEMMRPFLVKKVIDTNQKIIREAVAETIFDFSEMHEQIKEVQQGLRDAVAQPYGTANRLYDLPYKTAGKTGSAQVSNKTKTNAFFVGYGPFDKPQIAILILIEDAKEGSINTLPIAKDVLKWYYDHRL